MDKISKMNWGYGRAANLLPVNHRYFLLRHAQHIAFYSLTSRLNIAKHIIKNKIQKQQQCLDKVGVTVNFEKFIENLSGAENLEVVRGIEGAIAKIYFKNWRSVYHRKWEFTGRNRRPPKDPVNSMLSLGYALIRQNIGQRAVRYGFDPNISFLHEPKVGRPSLALDLMEPLRPELDTWVYSLIHRDIIKKSNFSINTTDGCRLDKKGRAIFYSEWANVDESWLDTTSREIMAGFIRQIRSIDIKVK